MKNSYTALAEAYDALMYDVDADAWAAYLDMLLGGAPKRVFEAACGTGNITLGLLEKGYDVTACDISEAAWRLFYVYGHEADVCL